MPLYPHPHYSWIWHKGYCQGAAWIQPPDVGGSEKLLYGHKLVQVCWSQGQRKTLGTFNSVIYAQTLVLAWYIHESVPL